MAFRRSLRPSSAGTGIDGVRGVDLAVGCKIGGDWIASSTPLPGDPLGGDELDILLISPLAITCPLSRGGLLRVGIGGGGGGGGGTRIEPISGGAVSGSGGGGGSGKSDSEELSRLSRGGINIVEGGGGGGGGGGVPVGGPELTITDEI